MWFNTNTNLGGQDHMALKVMTSHLLDDFLLKLDIIELLKTITTWQTDIIVNNRVTEGQTDRQTLTTPIMCERPLNWRANRISTKARYSCQYLNKYPMDYELDVRHIQCNVRWTEVRRSVRVWVHMTNDMCCWTEQNNDTKSVMDAVSNHFQRPGVHS